MGAEVERILVLRGGALGDFVLTLPLLTGVRRRFPQARIELLGYPDVASIACWGGLVDAVRRVDAAWTLPLFSKRAEAGENLREYLRQFSRVLAVWHDPEGTLSNALARCGAGQSVVVDPIPPSGSGIHAVDFMLRQVPHAWRCGATAARLVPSSEMRERAHALLEERLGRRRTYVVVHPGSGGRGENRNWPPSHFAALLDLLRSQGDAGVLLLEGPADEEAVRDTLAAARPKAPAVVKDLSVSQVAALLAEAGHFVGNDSGVAHVAAAVGARTVAIFGATDSAAWAPRGPRVRVLKPPKGPDGSPGPITEVTPDAVLDALGPIG